MKYYYKAIAANTIFVKSIGKTIPFEDAGGGAGILATEEKAYIDAIEDRISKRVGGVTPLTAEKYGELKKKSPTSKQRSSKPVPVLEQLRIVTPPDQAKKPKAHAAADPKELNAVKQAPAQPPAEPAKAEDVGPTLRPPKQ